MSREHGVDGCRAGRRAGRSFRIEEGPRGFYRDLHSSLDMRRWSETRPGHLAVYELAPCYVCGELRRAGWNRPGERRRASGRPVIAGGMDRAICTPDRPAGGLSTPAHAHPTLPSDSQTTPYSHKCTQSRCYSSQCCSRTRDPVAHIQTVDSSPHAACSGRMWWGRSHALRTWLRHQKCAPEWYVLVNVSLNALFWGGWGV